MSTKSKASVAAPSPLKLNSKLKLWFAAVSTVLVMGIFAAFITDMLYNPSQFNINKISLAGDAIHVDREELKRSVIDLIDGNYFSLDAEKITGAIRGLPWVEKVRLRRQWPDTLMINIEEYQPIALWGDERWLTTSEKLVSLPLPKNSRLPKLDGPVDSVETVWRQYQKWSGQFAQQGLRLSTMSLSRQDLYTLTLEYTTQQLFGIKNFEMVLSRSSADQQLDVFLSSYRQGLIEYPGQIKTVDLRYPNGFSVSRYEPEKFAQTVTN